MSYSATEFVSRDQPMLLAVALSRLLGWLYFAAWTASFWPQTLLMYRRGSVAGMSLDFTVLNCFGFVCYAIFNLSFLMSRTVQEQYRSIHRGQENLVRWNDAFFAVHALLIATWQCGAIFVLKRAPGQKVAVWCRIVLGVVMSVFGVTLAACIVGGGDDDSFVRWIDFVNVCSYIKLFITLIKYSPQIYLNFVRRSTRGFAIQGVMLDAAGGLLSLLQLVIDAQIINHDWSDVSGDPGKLGLAFISLFFDAAMLTQHYALYGDRVVDGEDQVDDEEQRRLLS